MTRMPDWLRQLTEIAQQDELGLWSWPGCVSTLGAFLALTGILIAITFAIHQDTEGLFLVIAVPLGGNLFVVSTWSPSR